MQRIVIAVLIAAMLLLGASATARADNPHCLGQSGNVGLPSGHVNDFGGCH
jgi:hypothetical protein